MTRKTEMLAEIKAAKAAGTTHIWYGHVEQAEPIQIDEAIRDIQAMDPDVMGEGAWGEWPEKTWPVLLEGTHEEIGETITINALDVVDMAYPTSRCLSGTDDFWASAEYIERMIDKKTGKRYDVVYLFEKADMTDADGEPIYEEDYPWDEEHVARVFAVVNGF